MLSFITQKIMIAYCCATLIFILVRLFNYYFKTISAGFLQMANAILLPVLLINLIAESYNALQCQSSNCYYNLLFTFLLGFIFQLLFIRKKFRGNVWLSFVSVLLLLTLINFQRLIYLALKFFSKDFLPSSWTTYYFAKDEVWITGLTVLYFGTCFFVALWRKKNEVSFKSKLLYTPEEPVFEKSDSDDQ